MAFLERLAQLSAEKAALEQRLEKVESEAKLRRLP
jgi:ubiquinone biosynthesis protein UbiJ